MQQREKTSAVPIKVSGTTKERIRFAATMLDCNQAQIVDVAVEEFVTRHADRLEQGIDRARAALRGGDLSAAAYLMGESLEDVSRVSGDPS